MCPKTQQTQFVAGTPVALGHCAASCASSPVLLPMCQTPAVVPGGQVARAVPVLMAKDRSFADYPPQYSVDADEALVHTYASFREEPAIALSVNSRRDDAWTLCVAVPTPALHNPTLLAVNYMIRYATTADEGNATIQTDIVLTTAALPTEVVSARAALDVYRPGGAPRMVDQAAALCLANTVAIKCNGGGEQWSNYLDTQSVTPNVRVRDTAQLYVIFNVEEHSTFRTARSLSIEVSATWQKEEVEIKAKAEEERKAKEAAEKEAQKLADKRAREADERQAREEERVWREEERQARREEAQERADAKQLREEERIRREQERAQAEAKAAGPKPSMQAAPQVAAVVGMKNEVPKPTVEAAPAVADEAIQLHIKETMAKLKKDPCPAGYEFVKVEGGYKCKGGTHFVSFEQLGMK
ncbi:hypothetical protein DFH07DRAFT_1030251 [Mycena maculata]|uniref:Uncharacterized protein n=1 Tax=Mycena maculata TaxID=230809 RepID=A0AAD7KB50_9AGAR|nr:hypothetical protein DFH07DRAFT_1030251 [Mycena maculata]